MRSIIPALVFLFFGISLGFSQQNAGTRSWADSQKARKATILIYWYESKPFIFKNEAGEMTGIEVEIMTGFTQFLKKKYNFHLTVQWKEAQSFEDTYLTVCHERLPGVIGASAFSITRERQERVNFTPPYMPDISVLISSKSIPIVQTAEEFDAIFSQLEAITIKGTTYEEDLLKLKKEREIDFRMRYVPSYENIQVTIQNADSAFGVIDLPTYMVELNRNAGLSVNRQNILPIKREGLAFIAPKESDWALPLSEYIQTPEFQSNIKLITGKYLDNTVYEFMESLAMNSQDEIMLLTFEKGIQQRDQEGKSKQILRESIFRNFLTAGISIILVFLVIIFLLYKKQNRINKILSNQKQEIEVQRLSIENQNLQLERRNNQLSHLNQEKNNLIKILAHDLRSPINQVQGLAQMLLLENQTLPADQKEMVNRIIDSSIRLNTMIGKILDVDAIESNRLNLQLEPLNLSVLLKRITESFEKTARQKNITIKTALTGDPVIQADALYFTEIIENLLSNALKFSKHERSITVSLNESNTYATICIIDEGPGLTPDDQEKIFQKFQRLSAKPTDGEHSTGLGLSIVKKYTEMMKGRVWYESEIGKGTTFFLEFQKA
jgi:signal transduction histidine kinase